MTITEFNKKIDRLIGDFRQPKGNPPEKIMLQLANDIGTVIRIRISTTGKDSNGVEFTPYSKQYKRWKNGEVKHRKGTKPKSKPPSAPKGGVTFKNYLLHNTMLNDIRPSAVRRMGNAITVKIGPRKKLERAKITRHTDYETKHGRAALMTISKEEERVIRQHFNKWLTDYINTIGL